MSSSFLRPPTAAAWTLTLPLPELSSPMFDHDMASLGPFGSHHYPRSTPDLAAVSRATSRWLEKGRLRANPYNDATSTMRPNIYDDDSGHAGGRHSASALATSCSSGSRSTRGTGPGCSPGRHSVRWERPSPRAGSPLANRPARGLTTKLPGGRSALADEIGVSRE